MSLEPESEPSPNWPNLSLAIAVVLGLAAIAVAGQNDPNQASLDKAMAVYEEAVEKARQELSAAIQGRVDAAIRSGNLDAVKALRTHKEAFESDGKLPPVAALRTQVAAYQQSMRRANVAAESAYAKAILAYTKAMQFDKAEAAKAGLEAFRSAAPVRKQPELVALYRFYDKRLREHVYTYGDGEPADWRRNPDMQGETVIGYATIAQVPGTTRLWRAIRGDGRHYFYLQAPKGLRDIRIEDFIIYVWAQRGDGRIAVYGCTLPDDTDFFLDQDADKVKSLVQDTFTGTGARRKTYAPAVYLHSKPPGRRERAAPCLPLPVPAAGAVSRSARRSMP
jgi:hypothetical protein